jgi:hypothetical protein
MATPLPTDEEVNLEPPEADEVQRVIAGVLGAVAPGGVPTRLQRDDRSRRRHEDDCPAGAY